MSKPSKTSAKWSSGPSKPLDERIAYALRKGVSFDQCIVTSFKRCIEEGPPLEGKRRLLVTFFVVILEHHRAISHLLGAGQYATSARSLMRPLLESSLRGAWLSRIATDDEIEKADTKSGRYPGPAKIAKLLDERDNSNYFTETVKEIDILNDFIHTGHEQLSRQTNGQPYDTEECLNLLNKARSIFAGAAIAILAGLGRQENAAFIGDFFKVLDD